MKRLLYIAFFLCLLSACGHKFEETRLALDRVQNLLEVHPDSALTLLDSVALYPGDLYGQNRYFLYYVQAKDELKQDIASDKEMLEVYHYFNSEGKDKELAALSALYCGRVLHQGKEYAQAIPYYNIAEEYGKASGDKNLQAMAVYYEGELYLDQYMFEEGKEKAAEANRLFAETNNHNYEINTTKSLAYCYAIGRKPDSAMIYYQQALELAQRYDHKRDQALITMNIGANYNQRKEYRKAIETFKSALPIDSALYKTGKVFINLSESYISLNQLDSARYYIDLALHIAKQKKPVSPSAMATIHNIYSEIEKQAGNYEEALRYSNLSRNNLATTLFNNKNKAIIEADKKYKFENMRNKNAFLSIKQWKLERRLFIVTSAVILITVLYLVKLNIKNKKLATQSQQLLEANDEILTLTEMLQTHDSTQQTLQEFLAHNSDILKKLATLEYRPSSESAQKKIKEVNTIIYGTEKIDWEILYKVLNSTHNGIFDRIRAAHPSLDENEFRICCLTYAKFGSGEISMITGMALATARKKTSLIRQKIGMAQYENYNDFFNKHLG